MSPDHLKLINEFIREKGNDIQDILPKLPGHPIRQAQAHLYKEIKLRFGVVVKEVDDNRFEEVMKLLRICVDNAAKPNIKELLTWVVPEPPKGSLDQFFED